MKIESVEIEVYEPVPDKPGYCQKVGNKSTGRVFCEVNKKLAEIGCPMSHGGKSVDPQDPGVDWRWVGPVNAEYWCNGVDVSMDTEFPFLSTDWIACYVVTGGSEGYYVHVDVIPRDEGRRSHTIFLAKFLTTQDEALGFCNLLTKVLGA